MNLAPEDLDEMTILADGCVVLIVPINEQCWCVMYIYTPRAFRGKGLARRKMTELIDKADAAEKDLFLLFAPGDGVEPERLREFYESYGFNAEGQYMLREYRGRT